MAKRKAYNSNYSKDRRKTKSNKASNKSIGDGMILSAFLSFLLSGVAYILTKDILYTPGPLEVGGCLFIVLLTLGSILKNE